MPWLLATGLLFMGCSSTPTDADGDGFESGRDCNDANASVNPEGDEVCDGLDNDCDGLIDEEDASDAWTWFLDEDGDGWGNDKQDRLSCSQPPGWVIQGDDCDDSDPAAHPGAVEFCDGADNDCDGEFDGSDAIDALLWYADNDNDGYGGTADRVESCEQPEWYVADSSDCDDTDPDVHPGAVDDDGDDIDSDCDGIGGATIDGNVFIGDLTITTLAAMEFFCGNFDVIFGTLTIAGDKLDNLDMLSCLTQVHGDLHIRSPTLLNASLPELVSVSAHLWVTESDALTALSVPALESVGGTLGIQEAPDLVDLDFLHLVSLGGSLILGPSGVLNAVAGLGNLQEIGGDLLISENALLTNIQGLYSVLAVGGDLAIRDNPSLPTSQAYSLRDAIGVADIGGSVSISGNGAS